MKTPLPKGIVASDLKRPAWDARAKDIDWNDHSFDLWHVTSFGWVIPTLLIGRARGRQTTDRTYATMLDGKLCRVGKGPHVTETCTVYVRQSSVDRLRPFLNLRAKGAGDAGMTRDRISSRRAQNALIRSKRGW